MKIGELAKRSGVSAPTLRFYEQVGLLAPAQRSRSGYREYDADAAARLAFIARAKTLGLTLEEIKELLDICAGQGCSASTERLRHVLAHKIAEVERQIEEQRQLRAALQDAFDRVAGRATLRRELSLIDERDCSCGAPFEPARADECRCCPIEEVTTA